MRGRKHKSHETLVASATWGAPIVGSINMLARSVPLRRAAVDKMGRRMLSATGSTNRHANFRRLRRAVRRLWRQAQAMCVNIRTARWPLEIRVAHSLGFTHD